MAEMNVCGLNHEKCLSVLVGADYYWQVVTGKYNRITNYLTAVETIFRWTLQGLCDDENIISNESVSTLFSSTSIENLWNLEALEIRSKEMEIKEFTKQLQTKCIRKTESRYEALLPWKISNGQLEDNRKSALSRLHSLMSRPKRDPIKLQEYDTTMREFIASGYAEQVVPASICHTAQPIALKRPLQKYETYLIPRLIYQISSKFY